MKRASSKPSARIRSTSSAGGSESIESAISALPPSFVRDTAMFAMLTPASPNIVPTRPITPGHVVVAEEDHPRRELEVDREPERAGEEEARLGPDRRARDLDVVDRDGDEVRVVARRAGALLGHLDPPLGRDHGRVDVVDRLVDAALEGAVQRRDRQQARVVLGDPAVEGERDPARLAAGELDREPAELGRERDVRAEHLEVLGADDRDVDARS